MASQQKLFKLYSYCHSSASWRVRIVLNLKGLKYEYIPVNLLNGDQRSDWYKKVNPNMAVPTLQDGEALLVESTAIIEYLEEIYQDQYKVLPFCAIQRAKIRGFAEVINSAMQPIQNLRLVNQIEKEFNGDKVKFALGWLDHGFTALETLLSREQSQSKFCFGDKPTMADVYLYPQVLGSARRFKIDIAQYPNLARVTENLQKEKAFIDSEPRFQPDFPQKK